MPVSSSSTHVKSSRVGQSLSGQSVSQGPAHFGGGPAPPPSSGAAVIDVSTQPVTAVYGTCLFGLETLLTDYAQQSSLSGDTECVRSVTVYTALVHKSLTRSGQHAAPSGAASQGASMLDSSASRLAYRDGKAHRNGHPLAPNEESPNRQHPAERTIASNSPNGETQRVFTLQASGVVLDGKRFPVVPAFTFRPALRYPSLEPSKVPSQKSGGGVGNDPGAAPASPSVSSRTVGPRSLAPGTKHADVVIFEVVEHDYEMALPGDFGNGEAPAEKAVHHVGVFTEGSVVGFGIPDVGIQALVSLVMHPYADPKDTMLVPTSSMVKLHNSVYRVSPNQQLFVLGHPEHGTIATPLPACGSGDGGSVIEEAPSSSVLRSFPALLKAPLPQIPAVPAVRLVGESRVGGIFRSLLTSNATLEDELKDLAVARQVSIDGRRKDRTFHPLHSPVAPVYIVPQVLTDTHVVVRSNFAFLESLPQSVVRFLFQKQHEAASEDGEVEESKNTNLPLAEVEMSHADEANMRAESIISTLTRPNAFLLARNDPLTVLPFMFGMQEVVLLRGYNALVLPIRARVADWQHKVSRTGALPMSLKDARVLKASLLRISSRQAKMANTRQKILWEERYVQARQHFLATSDHFEVGAVSEELKNRNEVLQSSVAYLCDQAHQEKDYYLEYIIILLIMVEVYLAMESHGLGLWDDEEGSEGSFGGSGHHHNFHNKPSASSSTAGVRLTAVDQPQQQALPDSALLCHGAKQTAPACGTSEGESSKGGIVTASTHNWKASLGDHVAHRIFCDITAAKSQVACGE